jgi:hypothetical protein
MCCRCHNSLLSNGGSLCVKNRIAKLQRNVSGGEHPTNRYCLESVLRCGLINSPHEQSVRSIASQNRQGREFWNLRQ